jgi:hypothetical protein
MACPSGCLNGGGQVKPGPGQTPAEFLEAAEAAYHHTQAGIGSGLGFDMTAPWPGHNLWGTHIHTCPVQQCYRRDDYCVATFQGSLLVSSGFRWSPRFTQTARL